MDERLLAERDALVYGIERSIRYHNRRRRFFEDLRLFCNGVSVIAGSATVFTALSQLGQAYLIVAAGMVTVSSAVDVLIDPVRLARAYEDLARRFIDVQKDILMTNDEQLTRKALRGFSASRLSIEADERPVLRVLDSLCHNEQLRAMGCGREKMVRVTWLQRVFANVVDIREATLRTYEDWEKAPKRRWWRRGP